ncbi:hypothetical protein L2E82_35238 [Cichorium intybus]|uniref:Uncharacterized protein n=1 Tax=Cichorium intybus TaxID=13427 RepID=A0ACB9BNK6_CICIN|nr:hypothetical protein L2E82_35238 [Cichorium intybus]
MKNPSSDLNTYIKGPTLGFVFLEVFWSGVDWFQRRLFGSNALKILIVWKEEIQRGERLVTERVHSSVFQKQGYVGDAGSSKTPTDACPLVAVVWRVRLLPCPIAVASTTESTGFTLESRVVNQSPRKSSSWVDRSDPGIDIKTVAHFRMAVTRNNGGPDAGTSSGGGPTDENLCKVIAEEVSREVLAAIP